MNPIAHIHDPSSSHIAAERVARSGKRARNKELVLRWLKVWMTKQRWDGLPPPPTAIELWNLMQSDHKRLLKEPQEVRRRLTDLLADGLVRQGPQRKCRIRGTTQVTWWPVEVQRGLFDG